MTRMKKVVLMIPQLRHGGAERVVSRLSYLMNSYYDLTVVVFDDSNITYNLGCKLVSLNVKPDPNPRIGKKILNLFKRIRLYGKYKRKNKIDITYSFGDTANLVNILSPGNDKKIISIRGFKRIRIGKGLKNRFILRPISKFICKKAHSIVSVSNLMTRTLATEYNIPITKIKTCYNGYDIENIVTLSKEDVQLGENNNVNQKNIIITAGTFRPEKGYWHLIKAFSLVQKKIENAKLIILGEDYQGNKKKVIELAQTLKVDKNIIFLGYKSNPFKYFANSSLYVLSSTTEGFPNAMVEAMACGLPVVASDCKSGPREILAPDSNVFNNTDSIEMSRYGILVNSMNDIENYNSEIIENCDQNLADAILEVLGNEELRLKYSMLSAFRAKEFSHQIWLKKQRDILLN